MIEGGPVEVEAEAGERGVGGEGVEGLGVAGDVLGVGVVADLDLEDAGALDRGAVGDGGADGAEIEVLGGGLAEESELRAKRGAARSRGRGGRTRGRWVMLRYFPILLARMVRPYRSKRGAGFIGEGLILRSERDHSGYGFPQTSIGGQAADLRGSA